MIPHLKVFFTTDDGEYKEVVKSDMENTSRYYEALRTLVVPFLASLALILDVPLSDSLRDSFDMWL